MMKKAPRKTRPNNDRETARVIEDVREDGEPRALEGEGKRAIVVMTADDYAALTGAPEPDIWANYDPEAVRKAFENLTGIFDGIDVEQLKREIREARGQDSIGRPAD